MNAPPGANLRERKMIHSFYFRVRRGKNKEEKEYLLWKKKLMQMLI